MATQSLASQSRPAATTAPQGCAKNRLLAKLSAEELARLNPYLELSTLRLGDVLCDAGSPIHFAWFPTTSIVSLQYVMENGATAEIAGVGNEGMVGVSLFMGGQTTPSRAVVHTAGHGYRLRANLLMEEFNRSGPLARLLLRYTQALITQMTLTAACNRHHSIDQQLSRWLLLTLDRMQTNDLIMTQDLIATMLGVRREGVTDAACKLKDMGVISYRRGHITVLDRTQLHTQVCECYAVVRREYDRLIGDPAPRHNPALARQ